MHGLELARRSNASLVRPRDHRGMFWAAGFCGAAVFSFFLTAVPLAMMLWLVGAGACCAVLAAIPWPNRDPSQILTDEIADPVLRGTYSAILAARRELELALANAPGLTGVARSVSGRCDDAVRICARAAPVANRLHAYLSFHDTWEIAREAAELRARATSTRDAMTARNLTLAAEACEQQIAMCDDLIRTRDRIQSRLDHVLASLRAFGAAIVKQQTAEDEQVALAGESIAEHVDGVRQELGELESALQLDAA